MKNLKNNSEPLNLKVQHLSNTFKVFILAVAFAFSGVLSASTEPVKVSIENSDSSLSQKVGKLLKNPSFEVEKDLSATVLITINKENELVVLSVDSEHETFESFIKSRLNYKKLEAELNGKARTFKVPITLKSI